MNVSIGPGHNQGPALLRDRDVARLRKYLTELGLAEQSWAGELARIESLVREAVDPTSPDITHGHDKRYFPSTLDKATRRRRMLQQRHAEARHRAAEKHAPELDRIQRKLCRIRAEKARVLAALED
jgi:hypothetical protein